MRKSVEFLGVGPPMSAVQIISGFVKHYTNFLALIKSRPLAETGQAQWPEERINWPYSTEIEKALLRAACAAMSLRSSEIGRNMGRLTLL